jgi:hypothetical protein
MIFAQFIGEPAVCIALAYAMTFLARRTEFNAFGVSETVALYHSGLVKDSRTGNYLY